MRKILVCMIALATLACTACKKNPAEEFEGEYTVTGTAHATYSVPLIGEQTMEQELDTMDCTIALSGDDGDVIVTMGGTSTTGTVDEDGMHLQPAQTEVEVMNIPIDVTFTFPTIKAPVDGKTSWTSTLSAETTVQGVTITVNGTADQTAVRK